MRRFSLSKRWMMLWALLLAAWTLSACYQPADAEPTQVLAAATTQPLPTTALTDVPTRTITPSAAFTETQTPRLTVTPSPTVTSTASDTPTFTVTATPTPTYTFTLTPSTTATPTATFTLTPSATATPTATFTLTPSATFTPAAEQRALTPVNQAAAWTPYAQDFKGFAMALVPTGCVALGGDPEALYREGGAWIIGVPDGGLVCFDAPFWISVHEVSNAQYAAFIDAGGYDDPATWTEAGWAMRQALNWTQPTHWDDPSFNGAQQPVVGVSWYEADTFARWAGMRLCTEPEWAYAARGPQAAAYPWGDVFDPARVNFCDASCPLDWRDTAHDDGFPYTAPVSSLSAGASWVGAQDLSGDAAEWTASAYGPYPYTADDGRESLTGRESRVIRGGAWNSTAPFMRSAYRSEADPSLRFNTDGIRLCMP